MLPPLPKHAGDRNRTSPFAFTGNRFEFRAVGSNQSIAGPLVALNTIVAEIARLHRHRAREGLGRRSEACTAPCKSSCGEIFKEHKAIVFNGDGYSAEWHAEAESGACRT